MSKDLLFDNQMVKSTFWKYRWMITTVLSLIILVTVITFNYNPRASGEVVLTTLATAQTGIFAIVFSVVILGVQLSTSQYAPRLAADFAADQSYQKTIGIFGASISSNIIGLFLFGQLSDSVLTLILVISISLAIGAFFTLYSFVSETLKKTTPEGILTHIQDSMTPESMLSDIEEAAEDPVNPDPFLTLISVIHSFITSKDRAGASLGLDILAERVSTLLGCSTMNRFKEGSPVDQSIKRVCTDQLPSTVEEAVYNDLTQIGLQVSESVKTIGEAAIENSSDRAFEHLITGHINLIDTLEFKSENERIRTEVMDTSGKLLKKAADEGLWDSTAIGTRLMGWVAAASIMMRDQEDSRNNRYSSLLILLFPKLLMKAVNVPATFEDHPIHEWLRLQRSDAHPVARLINSCYGSMAEITSAAIRYELRTEQRIVDWESVAYGWSEGLETLEQSNLDSMKQLWFGTVLYLEYLDAISPDHVMKGFNPHSRHRVSEKIGQKTVAKIKDESLDPSSPIELKPGGANPVEMPLTGIQVPVIPDAEITFREWVSDQVFVFGSGGFVSSSDDEY
ncbi:hypothetical protein A4G99_16115 [Haladaptatus sp. R4]|uniref:DUF2254 family protein n=1 Tax=Haladaptatus sp. R4 TaxID=1679489 RepID=UPI0007B4662C|nr:DUF2254 family protein [Haladaptatus sp. R4]KZN23042.1 hypothetical protein A4G99_16115 [Haladaptatus sp. R4]